MQPPFVLDLDDSAEGLVFRELAIDALQVSLMLLKDFNKAVHAQVLPPASLFEKGEASAENITHITATADI